MYRAGLELLLLRCAHSSFSFCFHSHAHSYSPNQLFDCIAHTLGHALSLSSSQQASNNKNSSISSSFVVIVVRFCYGQSSLVASWKHIASHNSSDKFNWTWSHNERTDCACIIYSTEQRPVPQGFVHQGRKRSKPSNPRIHLLKLPDPSSINSSNRTYSFKSSEGSDQLWEICIADRYEGRNFLFCFQDVLLWEQYYLRDTGVTFQLWTLIRDLGNR